MKGGSKEYWFVLTAENLSWYKDDEVSGLVSRLLWLFLQNPVLRGAEHLQLQLTLVAEHFAG